MLSSLFSAVLLGASLSQAAPILKQRAVTLDPAATEEAQQRDDTATRALTAVPITVCTQAQAHPSCVISKYVIDAQTSTGLCFSVDPLSGDFRENLTPVQLLPCDGTQGQQWDVITAGKHNNVPGTALIVSTLVRFI